jgi:hypothetical protein
VIPGSRHQALRNQLEILKIQEHKLLKQIQQEGIYASQPLYSMILKEELGVVKPYQQYVIYLGSLWSTGYSLRSFAWAYHLNQLQKFETFSDEWIYHYFSTRITHEQLAAAGPRYLSTRFRVRGLLSAIPPISLFVYMGFHSF